MVLESNIFKSADNSDTKEALRQIRLRAHANAIADMGQGVIAYVEASNLIQEFQSGDFEGIYGEISEVYKEREQRKKDHAQIDFSI